MFVIRSKHKNRGQSMLYIVTNISKKKIITLPANQIKNMDKNRVSS